MDGQLSIGLLIMEGILSYSSGMLQLSIIQFFRFYFGCVEVELLSTTL